MSRTTVDKVKTVIETGLKNDQIERLMEMANSQIDQLITDTDITVAVKTDIETWLTAHLIASGPERQLQSEKVHDVWITYQGKFGDFLRATTYGQMVLMLDTSGSMDKATKKKAFIRAIEQDSDNE